MSGNSQPKTPSAKRVLARHLRLAWELSPTPEVRGDGNLRRLFSAQGLQRGLSRIFPGSAVMEAKFNPFGDGFIASFVIQMPERPTDNPEWIPVNRQRLITGPITNLMTAIGEGAGFQTHTEVVFADYVFGDNFSSYTVEVRGHRSYS